MYSDKFTLSVVNLSCINLATEEDRAYGIDYWAAMFKAKTWEEVKKLAKQISLEKEKAVQELEIERLKALLALNGITDR